jgi:hypothetical protein
MKQKKLQRKTGDDDGTGSNGDDDHLDSDRLDDMDESANHELGHMSPRSRDIDPSQLAAGTHGALYSNVDKYPISYSHRVDDRTDCENEEIDVVSDDDSFHGNIS